MGDKSKLLKESIADAKAVRETAIANAKLMLEEVFAPRIKSVISKQIQEGSDFTLSEEYGADDVKGTDSTKIGAGKGKSGSGTNSSKPSGKATQAHTKLDPETTKQSSSLGAEDKNNKVVDKLTETDDEEFDLDEILRELEGVDDEEMTEGEDSPAPEDDVDVEDGGDEEVEESYDDLDLDEILRELEADEEDFDVDESTLELDEADDLDMDDLGEGEDFVEEAADESDEDETVDLDELLRELGLSEEDEVETDAAGEEELEELRTELDEAYKTIKSLKSTINEVNLLNAKLLYANKLFRHYDLNNDQKMKVVENIDRTTNVREVKLVYATLAESMKFSGTKSKKVAKRISESFASKPTRSTAPKKEILAESDQMADRFKKLAGIIK